MRGVVVSRVDLESFEAAITRESKSGFFLVGGLKTMRGVGGKGRGV